MILSSGKTKLLPDVEILGVMYSQMVNRKNLEKILADDLMPLMSLLDNEVQASLMFSSIHRAFQRGRLFYTRTDVITFALSLCAVPEAGLRKFCTAFAIRILMDERDFVTLKRIVAEYEQFGGDESVVKAGKIAYLWNEMADPSKYVACEQEMKSLVGV